MIWSNANTHATTLGGYLVSINDQEEQDFIVENFVPLSISAGNSYGRMWIGLTDEDEEGSFVWTSGEELTYSNWLSGEPSNSRGLEHYVEIRTPEGGWNDLENNSNWLRFSVVEIVPEPCSLLLIGFGGLFLKKINS